MFLKGQYVEQSTLIGLGWLGVAIESGIQEWQALFDKLYETNSIEKKEKIDFIVSDYKSKFGLKTQNVTCRKSTNGFSKKILIKCTKSDKLTKVYDIDLTESDFSK